MNDYGEATVVASTPGNSSLAAASATITIKVVQGKGPNQEAVLGFAGGGLVPDGKIFSLKTGEELKGTDIAMAAPANCYVLDSKSADESLTGIGFYEFAGTLTAHKAYLLNSNAATLKWLPFIFNSAGTTTIIDRIPTGDKQCIRVLREGHIYFLLPDGTTYDAQSKKVQ